MTRLEPLNQLTVGERALFLDYGFGEVKTTTYANIQDAFQSHVLSNRMLSQCISPSNLKLIVL